jgi:hypothetical protein
MWGFMRCGILRLLFLPCLPQRCARQTLCPSRKLEFWNFRKKNVAKSLILKEKMTIPEKIPVGIKLYKLGISVVLLYIWTWNWLEPHEPKDTLRNE